MDTVNFNPDGGPLSVLASSGVANPGHYELFLFEPNETTVVQRIRATAFGAPADNTHALPGTASQQDGRVLDLLASVGLLDPSKAFAVSLTVLQDGKILASPKESGTGSDITKECELFVKLAAAQVIGALTATNRARSMNGKPAGVAQARAALGKKTRAMVGKLTRSSKGKSSSRGSAARGRKHK